MLIFSFPLEFLTLSVRVLAGVVERRELRSIDGELGELIEVEYSPIVVSIVSSVWEHVLS